MKLRAIIAFDVGHDKVREVMELLSGRSEVKGLAATSGRFDIIVLVWFTSTNGLFQFIENEVSKMEGVRNTETFICLHVEGVTATGKPSSDVLEQCKELGRKLAQS